MSLASLYLAHVGELRRFLARRIACRETVADLAQEAFVRLLACEHLPAVTQRRAYLFRVAEHLAIDHYRRDLRQPAATLPLEACPELICPAPTPERYVLARQQLAALQRAIDELPPRCRTVFISHKFDGVTQRELAAQSGVSVNAIEKLLIRALVHLRLRVPFDD